ncbi:pyridoxal phosphate-dependent decarboxylase family protein [Saccharopolyspora dendranthemae]|uniref:L-2,4-diaminobutyrate decarboxylase n=1 Tax=Saccharopolyspora dendranthemae TaxID=1181886 RepID=A0A561U853_9PSEU|nr:pyridoxal-dependent decarboxylase [Saccharopolyspora dendranthemae]TWF95535.1 L-2,4-diaminobutyrate decarboxylase [Saccharopolyspora dendranthemae]
MTTSIQLAGGIGGPENLRPLLAAALDALGKGTVDRGGPLPTGGADAVGALFADDVLPVEGRGAESALDGLTKAFTAGAADPAHPACVAHLHTPPLALAVAADLVAGVLNSSLDSWDQAPSGTHVESQVVRALAGLVGYDPEVASGAVTSGGTESNLTALLLARDHALSRAVGAHAVASGIPAEVSGRLRILCSETTHFSVARSAGVLGLGEESVIQVPLDRDHRMDPGALRSILADLRAGGDIPIAVVATAGTTDLGVIDPLPEVAEVAAEHDTWLHVDAAYGGGALFSDRLASLLTGVDSADSVALDLHKLGWQPVAAGVLLARQAAAFDPIERRVAYLNTADDEDAGFQSLLGRSLRTTRRPDAFKIAVTFQALGRRGLGELVDRCHEQARSAAATVQEHPRLELYREPVLTTVIFRYRPERGDPDAINAELRRALLRTGRAVVGRTELDGAVWLKLTLLNPNTTETDINALLAEVLAAATDEEAR